MFQKRLVWFAILLAGVALVVIARLVQIQVLQAAEYERLADRILSRRPEYVPAPRGTVFARGGEALLTDVPTSDVCVHYGALTGRETYLLQAARALRKRGDYPAERDLRDIAAELRQQIDEMWWRLAGLTGVSQPELLERARGVVARVERWRAASQQEMIREENQLQPVLEDVDNEAAVAVRLELERYPWLRVVPSSRRVAAHADALPHVLGRMGEASPERIVADPLHGDELRGLRKGDYCGVSGIERLADSSLRGRRGRVTLDYAWQPLDRIEPVPGHDVHLTIDLDLQEYVLRLLEEAEKQLPESQQAGASAVVIDVATREVRALVSYPVYDYGSFNDQYEQLRRDGRRLPLLFRAVQAQYPPGSICKAITLVGGLSDGVITPTTRFHCTGHLLPDQPDRFRCWIYNQYDGLTHDMAQPEGQDGESAVRNSCNIYFFQVGGRLGPQRLCEWFARFGLGRPTGTGLIEEADGIVPDQAWMTRVAGRGHQTSDAWNFAIGQGEVTITPLQAANVTATIASGQWAPPRLAYDDSGHAFGDPLVPPTTFDEGALHVLRRGMWRVVNEHGGTAARYAALNRHDYELCGKTGSAQTPARPVAYRYTFEWPDGRRDSAVAYLEEDARAALAAPDETVRCVGRHVAERFPRLDEGERLPSHAWFIGYTQPASTPRGDRPQGKVYAIAVIIEFGGSGGATAGPVAKKIAEYLLQ
jgi:cell division protein FtsI/penicillin-binding protein 2